MGTITKAQTRIQKAIDSNSTSLNLSGMSLTDDDLDSLMANMQQINKLQLLNLGNNLLTTLPETIATLTDLTKLLLTENQFTALPATIGSFSKLRILDVSENDLSTLPRTIGNLTNLEWLNVFGNKLTSVPDTIGNLGNLRAFVAHFNRLTSIPETIDNFRESAKIFLVNNPLTTETMTFLDGTFGQDACFNRVAFDAEDDSYLVLGRIYGKEQVAAMEKCMDSLEASWSFLNGSEALGEALKRLAKARSVKESKGSLFFLFPSK